MSLRAILFDLDGTLTDSGPGIMGCLKKALAEMGERIPSEETLRLFVGPPLAEAFAAHCGMSPDRCEEAIRVYRKHYSAGGLFENTVYDGVREMLAELCARGVQLYLATSKPEHFAKAIMEHFSLEAYFTYIGGALTDGKRREKAEVIEYVLAENGLSADEVIMIGDRKYDVEGAASFGIPTLGVTWGYGTEDELTKAGAKWIAHTPREVVSVTDAILAGEETE